MGGLTCELVVSRSVRDTAAVLDAVHGMEPGDPYAAPDPGAARTSTRSAPTPAGSASA